MPLSNLLRVTTRIYQLLQNKTLPSAVKMSVFGFPLNSTWKDSTSSIHVKFNMINSDFSLILEMCEITLAFTQMPEQSYTESRGTLKKQLRFL